MGPTGPSREAGCLKAWRWNGVVVAAPTDFLMTLWKGVLASLA